MIMDELDRPTTLTATSYAIPGAPLGPDSPLPRFRSPNPNMEVRFDDSVPPAKKAGAGRDCSFRVLPYLMQDRYGRERCSLKFDALVLENGLLRATFLPMLGGRLVSLFSKTESRELLSKNPVFQPANLAICNAWFSGGIEWNIGHFGHACHTASPIFAARLGAETGDPLLRLYDFERMTGQFWQIDFRLPPGSPLLYASVRIINSTDREETLYWWTNIAVPEIEGVRVLAPSKEALYLRPSEDKVHCFGLATLPRLPSLSNDGSYPLNSTFANEFFFQCEGSSMPWEAAIYRDGKGFFECSTKPLSYRKLFCWGSHPGGRHWQEFLAEPGVAYMEIQAGLSPTQLHGAALGPGASIAWTQAFGALSTDPELAHDSDWSRATRACEESIRNLVDKNRLSAIHEAFLAEADTRGKLLFSGSGWGALERARLAVENRIPLPSPGLDFPESTLGSRQMPWLRLLREKILPAEEEKDPPDAWMVSPEWRSLLETSLGRRGGSHWLSWLYLGVMLMEAGDPNGAGKAWTRSHDLKANPWALRNLAVLALRMGDRNAGLKAYRDAWRLEEHAARESGRPPCGALAEEYMGALVDANLHAEALELAASLPSEIMTIDYVRLHVAKACLALGHLAEVASILEHEFAVIREGDNLLTDLWFELQACLLAQSRQTGVTDAIREEARTHFAPPARIDFRMLQQRSNEAQLER